METQGSKHMGSSASRRGWWPASYVLGYFLGAGLVLWAIEGQVGSLVFMSLIGLSVGTGFFFHARLRPARKRLARRASAWVVGLSLLLGAGIFGRQSFQLEGFFFYVFAGVFGGVVVHYLVAKLVGPLVIGRAWCSWGCWIWMVLELLPFKRSPGPKGELGRLRVVHLAASAGLVGVLAFGLGYDHGFEWKETDGLWWFLGGVSLYYAAGIGLAFALEDNRAFCKVLCPVSVFLEAGSRFSLLKVVGSKEGCDSCGACTKICPMDVPVMDFVSRGTRVLDRRCTLCQSCVGACPEENLHLSLGLDRAA